MSIAYEEMVPSAQAAYNKTNNFRTKLMKISWVGAAVMVAGFIIISIIGTISDLLGTELPSFFYAFLVFIIGGMIPMIILGCVHSFAFFKPIVKAVTSVVLVGWLIAFFALYFMFAFACFTGGPFLLIDTIRYFQKKPLIFKFEHEGFMKKPEAQRELFNKVSANAQTTKPSAEETLKNLKDMFDNNLITEEEYNNKKAELLNRM